MKSQSLLFRKKISLICHAGKKKKESNSVKFKDNQTEKSKLSLIIFV